MVDIAIVGGMVFDGRGAEGYEADLAIHDGHIVSLSNPAPPAELIIDARGKAVCPGFIDMHAHSGLQVFRDPCLAPKIRQGITTEVIGVDGISPAPVTPAGLENRKRYIAAIDGTIPDGCWQWHSFAEYLDALRAAGPSTNLLTLIPHGCVRDVVMGLADRPASAGELAQMAALVDQAFKAGAAGLSFGLNYYPGAYAGQDEIATLISIAAEYEGVVMVHVRNEGDLVVESVAEMIHFGRTLGAKIHISHLKIVGAANNHLLAPLLSLLEGSNSNGTAVSFDQYPYPAGSTQLAYLLPPWVHETGARATVRRLRSTAARRRIRQQVAVGLPGWENLFRACGPDGIVVSYVESEANQGCLGRSLTEIAAERDTDPLEVVFDLLAEEELRVGMIDHYGDETSLSAIMRSSLHTVGTDGIFYDGYSHPRLFGAFPRVLGKYVREEKLLSLPRAIEHITSRPARILGLEDRGVLEVGRQADLVVFDPATVRDLGSFASPSVYPVGIDWVIVNGQPTVFPDGTIRARAGRVLNL